MTVVHEPLCNRPQMDEHLADWLEGSYRVRKEQRQNPPAFVASLAALREERGVRHFG
jgi:hypothetical protein